METYSCPSCGAPGRIPGKDCTFCGPVPKSAPVIPTRQEMPLAPESHSATLEKVSYSGFFQKGHYIPVYEPMYGRMPTHISTRDVLLYVYYVVAGVAGTAGFIVSIWKVYMEAMGVEMPMDTLIGIYTIQSLGSLLTLPFMWHMRKITPFFFLTAAIALTVSTILLLRLLFPSSGL